MNEKDVEKVTVCSNCLRATCWQGMFMCDESRYASTIEKDVQELAELNLEHPSYYSKRISEIKQLINR